MIDPRSAPRLIVPTPDKEPWPSLGPEICDWFEANLVHGPGDVLGRPLELLDEFRLLIYRAYEVFPRGHEREGRRRFKRVALFRRKGAAKTELAAMIAIAEMDPTAPVRCDGFRVEGGVWVPVGRPVRDPYIPLVATTEDQSDELAYGAARAILEHCDLGSNYVIGLERIMHLNAPGEMKALASAPNARDGSRTSFQVGDETHLFVSARLKQTWATMLRNIPKRRDADAWSFEISTMYAPGEESVAEATHAYALAVLDGKVEDPTLLFDHRQASELHDLDTKSGLRAAIVEASGDAIEFADVESIAAQYHDPNGDRNEFRRYWLNQRRRRSTKWVADDVLEDLVSDRVVEQGAEIVLAFDGSQTRDSTVLVGCTVEEKPHVFVWRHWQRPGLLNEAARWRTPRGEVMDAVADAMEHFDVVEFAPDPYGWGIEVEEWEETYDSTEVFATNKPARMGPACDDMEQAIRDAAVRFEDHRQLFVHFANCVPVDRRGYRVVTKSSADSPDKIDLAVGAIIALHRAKWHFVHGGSREPMFAYA